MSVRLIADVLDHVHGLPHGSKLVLLCMADYANKEGLCWPSFQSIADRADMTRRHVIRVVDELVTVGLVQVVEAIPYKPKTYLVCAPTSDTRVTRGSDAHVTSDAHDTSDADDTTLVTPMSLGSDAHVTSTSDAHVTQTVNRTVKEPSMNRQLVENPKTKPKKAMPDNGPAQHLVKVWAEITGIEPSDYGKSVKAGQGLAKAGVTDGELRGLQEYMANDPFWSEKGYDLMNAYGQLDKFRQKQRTPQRASGGKQSIVEKNFRNVELAREMVNGKQPQPDEADKVYDTTGVVQ